MNSKFKAGDKVKFIKYDNFYDKNDVTVNMKSKEGDLEEICIDMNKEYYVLPSKNMPILNTGKEVLYPINDSPNSHSKKFYIEESYLMKVITKEDAKEFSEKYIRNSNWTEVTTTFEWPPNKNDSNKDDNTSASKSTKKSNEMCDFCECELRKKYDELLKLSNDFVAIAKLLERVVPTVCK